MSELQNEFDEIMGVNQAGTPDIDPGASLVDMASSFGWQPSVNYDELRTQGMEDDWEITRGVKRGVDQTAAMLGGAVGVFGDAINSDTLRDWGFNTYQDSMHDASLHTKSIQEVQNIDSLSDTSKWFMGTIGELAPSMVEGAISMFVGAGIGGLAARQAVIKGIEKSVAAQVKRGISKDIAERNVKEGIEDTLTEAFGKGWKAGGNTGMIAGTGALEGGGMWGEDAETHGIYDANAGSAVALGLISGGSEVVSPGGVLLRRIGGVKGKSQVADKVADTFLKRIAPETAKAMSGEAAQEVFQAFLGTLNKKVNDPTVSLTDREAINEYINSAAAGAAGGLVFGGVNAAFPGSVEQQPEHYTVDDVLDDEAAREAVENAQVRDTVAQAGAPTMDTVLDGQETDMGQPLAGQAPTVSPNAEGAGALYPQLQQMVNEIFPKPGEDGEKPDNPDWVKLKTLQRWEKETGESVASFVNSSSAKEVLKAVVDGQPLTEKQQKVWSYLRSVAEFKQIEESDNAGGNPDIQIIPRTDGKYQRIDMPQGEDAGQTQLTESGIPLFDPAIHGMGGEMGHIGEETGLPNESSYPAEMELEELPLEARESPTATTNQRVTDIVKTINDQTDIESLNLIYEDIENVVQSDPALHEHAIEIKKAQVAKASELEGIIAPEDGMVQTTGEAHIEGDLNAEYDIPLPEPSTGKHEVINNTESVAHGQEVNTNPTEKQKEAENYKMAHVKVDGLDISIENPAGSTRSGKAPDGKEWSIEMKNDYGRFKGTKGYDKDHVDVFLAPGYKGGIENVHVVNQVNRDGTFDEHKVVMGAESSEAALELYNANYEKGWTGGKSVVEMPVDEFKEWVKGDGPSKGELQPDGTMELVKDHGNNEISILPPIVEHTTKKGKTLKGYIVKDISKEEAKTIDKWTWKKDGGFFIREQHKEALGAFLVKSVRETSVKHEKAEAKEPNGREVKENAGETQGVAHAETVRKESHTRDSKRDVAEDEGRGGEVLHDDVYTETITEAQEGAENNDQASKTVQSDKGITTPDVSTQGAEPVKEEKPDPVRATKGADNKLFTQDAAEKARALLKSKLKNLNSGVDPEMMQAGITLAGFHIEAGARSFVAYSKAMIQDLGEGIKPFLRSFYEGVRYYPGFDSEGMNTPEFVDEYLKGEDSTLPSAKEEATVKENKEEGTKNVTDERSNANLERDSRESTTTDGVGEKGVSDDAGADGGTGEQGVQGADSKESSTPGSVSTSGRKALSSGKRGDISPYSEHKQSQSKGSTPGIDDDNGSAGSSVDGKPTDTHRPEASGKSVERVLKLKDRIKAQKNAEDIPTVLANSRNIAETLPILHKGQQQDVLFAEKRFVKPKGYGVLFTNGTGTGKTFTGLGIIKRYARQGKNNILITVPSDKIANDWVKSATNFNLNVSMLDSVKDHGQGIVVTTYANAGQNSTIAQRKWDLVVTDEAHYLKQSQNGDDTLALDAVRAITYHPEGRYSLYKMRNSAKIDRLEKLFEDLDESRKKAESKTKQDALQKRINTIEAQLRKSKDRIYLEVENNQGKKRPRVVFLSATPFAYEKTVDWAEGYLFDYPKVEQGAELSYNAGGSYERFMMSTFGYRMRYNRLTEPGPEVDRGIMQRQFNAELKKSNVLSGRMLEVDYDYDRRFILTENSIGLKIDEGLEYLWDNERYRDLGAIVRKKFDHLSRRFLLEAIKAKEVVPHIKEHMALSRKVVVFHDYKKGGGFNPFNLSKYRTSEEIVTVGQGEAAEAVTIGQLVREFESDRPDLQTLPIDKLPSALQTLTTAFPDGLVFNGDISKKDRRKAVEDFNVDGSANNLIIVQSAAGKEGISLHDTTGEHQRVLFNLGLPTQPTTAVQEEGRIYRVGQSSNAIFRYLNTGTNWERFAFASTIAQRTSAAENLALGEEARALKDSFIEGYEQSDSYPAGHDGEGTGGRERDKAANAALTEWDRARTLYFANQKKTSRTKAQEGKDYFATPEPLGLKMVEWANIQEGDEVLEPSAGHGAIARWFPESNSRTVIEPSSTLASRLKMTTDADLKQEFFEDHHIVNKYDAIVMNPPFGSGGKTAIEHLNKATQHLRDGGRVVALIPEGPAADKKFDKWFYEEDDKGHAIRPELMMVANIHLPSVTFERAGTSVKSRIVIIEKVHNENKRPDVDFIERDYTREEEIKDLFERIENSEVPDRVYAKAGKIKYSAPFTSNGDGDMVDVDQIIKERGFVENDNQEVIEKIRHHLPDNGGSFRAYALSHTGNSQENERTKGRDFAQESKVAEKLAKSFGKKIVWLSGEHQGFMVQGNPDLKDYVFLNPSIDIPAHIVFGHELSHHVENDAPELFDSLYEAVSPLIKDIPKYQFERHLMNKYTTRETKKEIIGDLLAESFNDRRFWKQVEQHLNPSAWNSLVHKVLSFLGDILDQFKGSKLFRISRFYTDVEQAREVLAKTVAQYKQGVVDTQGSYSGTSNEKASFLPAFDQTIEETVEKMGSFKFIKNKKKDSTFLDRVFRSPEYYFKKAGAAGRVLQAALLRRDVRYQKETEILGGFVDYIKHLKKDFKKAYQEANEYLINADRESEGFRIKASENDDSWTVKAPAWVHKDSEEKKIVGKFDDEAKAIEAMIKAESEALEEHGFTPEAIEAVKQARELTNRGFDVMAADMRKIIAEAREKGLPDPFIGDGKVDESGRYGVYAKGKGKKPIALFASQMEADQFLENAAEMISYAVYSSKGKKVRNFKNQLNAKKWADRRKGHTVKGEKKFANLVVKRRSTADMRPLTVKEALAQMGDFRGIYFPRIREAGEYVLVAKKDGANPIRKHFDIPAADLGGKAATLENIINSTTPAGRELKKLRLRGYDVTMKKDDSPAEDVFQATNLVTSLDAILQTSMETLDPNNSADVKAGQHINQIMTMQLADLFKSRGYLSSRIKRLAGDTVWEGYEEDMSKALIQYGKNVAAGTAKRDVAREMVLAFSGRDYSWEEYKQEVDNPDWEDYKGIVEKRRIDERTQKNLFRDVRSFMVDVLRNDEAADRIMGTLKGLAVLKYLGFRVSSAAVNLTNMVQGVPASIAGYTDVGMSGALRHVTKAANAYQKYRRGKASKEDQRIFEYISAMGWDEAQFNHDAASMLRSKVGDGWNKFMTLSMGLFGAAEKVNRATTIYAAFQAVRESNPTAQDAVVWEKAKEISDRAHGIYGKETLPAWARGKFNPLKLTYTFQKFSHNYMMNMWDLGFTKKEYSAAAWMLLSPAILAGSSASLAGKVLFAAAGVLGLGGDDPEEEFYKWAENTFSGGTYARHGVVGGLAGINIKGSLQITNPMPTNLPEVFGPVGGIYTDIVRGTGHAKRGEGLKAIEALLPTAFGSMSKSWREGHEGVTTGNYGSVFYGNEPLTASDYDAFLRFFSFNPSRLSGIREMQWHEKQVKAKYQEDKTAIYAEIKRLRLKGEGISPEVLKAIYRYNERVALAGRPDIKPITMKGIKSMLKRNQKASKLERNRTV